MPLLPLVLVAGLIIEYFVSRVLMLKLTQRPKFIDERLGLFYFIASLAVAIGALFFYPIGPVFLALIPRLLPESFLYRNCSMYNAISRI